MFSTTIDTLAFLISLCGAEENFASTNFVNKKFSVIENQNKQQIRHKQTRVNEVDEIYILYYNLLSNAKKT